MAGGFRAVVGAFLQDGEWAGWWSSTEYTSINLDYNNKVTIQKEDKINGFSVRCIKD